MSKVQTYAIMGGLIGFVSWLGQLLWGPQFVMALTSIVFCAFAGAAIAVLTGLAKKDGGDE